MRERLQVMAEQCGDTEYDEKTFEYLGQAELALRRLWAHMNQMEQAANYLDVP